MYQLTYESDGAEDPAREDVTSGDMSHPKRSPKYKSTFKVRPRAIATNAPEDPPNVPDYIYQTSQMGDDDVYKNRTESNSSAINSAYPAPHSPGKSNEKKKLKKVHPDENSRLFPERKSQVSISTCRAILLYIYIFILTVILVVFFFLLQSDIRSTQQLHHRVSRLEALFTDDTSSFETRLKALSNKQAESEMNMAVVDELAVQLATQRKVSESSLRRMKELDAYLRIMEQRSTDLNKEVAANQVDVAELKRSEDAVEEMLLTSHND